MAGDSLESSTAEQNNSRDEGSGRTNEHEVADKQSFDESTPADASSVKGEVYEYEEVVCTGPSKRLKLDEIMAKASPKQYRSYYITCELVQQGFVCFTVTSPRHTTAALAELKKDVREQGQFARQHGLFYIARPKLVTGNIVNCNNGKPNDGKRTKVAKSMARIVIVLLQLVSTSSSSTTRRATGTAICQYLNSKEKLGSPNGGKSGDTEHVNAEDGNCCLHNCFDRTKPIQSLGKLGNLIDSEDAIKVVQLCFDSTDGMWAQANQDLADTLFDFPYPTNAMRALGYTSMPLSKCPSFHRKSSRPST